MHLLFLTDNFPPEVNAPASRTFEHCKEWVKAGHNVTIITCAPNFPHGKLYKGYENKLYQKEEMEGIVVIRVWSYITANEGIVKRTLDYISYMVSSTIASVFVKKPDIVIGTSPQFFTACGAYLASRFKRCPFVFELRDLWPESIKAVGAVKDSLLIRVFKKLEYFLYRKADRIISVTHSFKEVLIANGVSSEKIDVITNGVDLSHFKPMEKDLKLIDRYQLHGKFVAGYVGTHGMAHALHTIVDCAEIIQQTDKEDKFRFLLLGAGAAKQSLIRIAKEKSLKNIIFIDPVPKAEVIRYWSILDVSIIHLKKTDLFKSVIPSKLFECMGMGVPVLHGVEGESADIVKKEKAGITFEPENAQELAAILKKFEEDTQLLALLKTNTSKAAFNYDRNKLARKMMSIFKRILGAQK